MRTELLYNPRLLCERLAIASVRRRRLSRLKGTPAAHLTLGHIDCLELLTLAHEAGVGVVYDVGANVGTFTLLTKSVIPDAEIHAFEPFPEHQEGFRRSSAGLSGVHLHPVALGSENTEAILHVTDFSDASSLLPSNEANSTEGALREVSRAAVKVVRLDDFCEANNLPLPDLIKLDIQGYELEALRGASACLRTAKAVISEVSFIEYYERQCLFHEIVAILAGHGFFLRAFGVNTPTGMPVDQTDALFMRTTS